MAAFSGPVVKLQPTPSSSAHRKAWDLSFGNKTGVSPGDVEEKGGRGEGPGRKPPPSQPLLRDSQTQRLADTPGTSA